MDERKHIYLFHKNDEKNLNMLEPLKDFAEKQGFTFVSNARNANIIASVGGDGAFLQAVRQTGFRDDCLYVGISTGQLGFYCDFDVDEPETMLRAMQSEHIEVRRYPVIEAKIDEDATFYCLNECSIRSSIIKTFVIDVDIDDLYFETFRGDGMIVSTPTGSTAYNRSVNGAVVDPKLPCLQVSELASINNNHFRTLGSPFILNGERQLNLRIAQGKNDYPIIGMDNEALSIRNSEQISIRLSDKRIKTVKLKNNSFWHKVKRSFL